MNPTTENSALFRISHIDRGDAGGTTTLRLEGRLTTASLAVFTRACAPYFERPGTLRLDVSGLVYLDQDAIRALRRLMRQQVSVLGGSPFIAALIDEEAELTRHPCRQ